MPTISSGDADIYYETTGEGDPLLWIMGLGLDSRMLMMQTAAFPAYKNIVLDNRGTGRSSVPPGPYSMDQFAADVIAVLEDAGIDRAHVVGISRGGAIAQHVALKAPERVRSLTLAATWAGPNEWHRRLDEIGLKMADDMGFEWVVKHTMILLFTPKFFIQQTAMVNMIESMATEMAAPLEPFRWQVHACMEHNVRDRLPSLDLPTLVVGGKRDIFIPPELSEEIASLVPGSKLTMLQTGHAFVLEEAAEFNTTLAGFIAAH